MAHDLDEFVAPPGRYIGLWSQEQYSDIRIRLVQYQTKRSHVISNDGEDLLKTDGGARTFPTCNDNVQVLLELPAHRKALAEGSTYFSGLLSTGEALAMTPAKKKRKTGRCASSNMASYDVPCNSAEEAAAIMNVLKYMYTHELPEDINNDMLAKMITASDYLGVDLCLTACAHALLKQPADEQLLQNVCSVLDVLQRSPVAPQLLNAVKTQCKRAISHQLADGKPAVTDEVLLLKLQMALLSLFGDVRAVITDDALLLLFCSLPLAAIELWGSLDQLEVDSENSLAVVISYWWQHQRASKRTETCKQKLTALLRLPLLSPSFLAYGVEHLPWFIAPSHDYKFVCTLLHFSTTAKYGQLSKVLPHAASACAQARQANDQPHLDLSWHAPIADLQQLVDTGQPLLGPSGFWQGYTWQLGFTWSETTSRIGLSVTLVNAIPGHDASQPVSAAAKIISFINGKVNSGTLCKHYILRSKSTAKDARAWTVYQECNSKDMAMEMRSLLGSEGQLHVCVHISEVE